MYPGGTKPIPPATIAYQYHWVLLVVGNKARPSKYHSAPELRVTLFVIDLNLVRRKPLDQTPRVYRARHARWVTPQVVAHYPAPPATKELLAWQALVEAHASSVHLRIFKR